MSVATDPGAPAAPPTFRIGFGATAGASSFSAWRCAGRLAWREVRRRPGRTILVVILVMVPTLAMTLGVILARTDARWQADDFTRDAGRVADIALDGTGPIGGGGADPASFDDAHLAEVLPPDARWTRFRSVGGTIRSAGDGGRATWAVVTDLRIDDPVVGGLVDVRSGAPPGPGEVVVTERLAGRLGVGVGDTLRLERPAGAWRVSGLAVTLDGFEDHRLVFDSFDWGQAREELREDTVLIDLPGQPGWPEVEPTLTALGGGRARAVPETMVEDAEVESSALAWGWVAGALGLVVMGIVISAAFATSARRQLVTLGQLAAQGAPRPTVRRMLALQGWWTGLLGATTGAAAGVGLTVGGRSALEQLWAHPLDTVVVRPSDLVIIVLTGAVAGTLAALLPARSAARVPVLAALSGRRPTGRVPRLLVPVGLVLVGGGLGLIALAVAAVRPPNGDAAGADASLVALVAILGGLGVLFGACCASPMAVDLSTRAVTRLGGVARLAARSLGRARGRSAAVVTAIAVVGAAAVLATTVMAARVARTSPDDVPYLPRHVVVVTTPTPVAGSVAEGGVPAELQRDLERILPGSTFHPRRMAVPASVVARSPEGGGDTGLSSADPVPPGGPVDEMLWWSAPLVADEVVLDMAGLSAGDRRRLDEVGVMALTTGFLLDDEGRWVRPETTEVDVDPSAPSVVAAVAQNQYRSGLGGQDVLVTEEEAARLGLTIVESGAYAVAPADLTDDQIDRLDDLRSLTQDSAFLPSVGDGAAQAGSESLLDWQWPEGPTISVELLSAVVVGVALLLTLLVVAIGLALSATESRDERDVLVAVGARPRTLRRMAGVKALILSGTGVVMAVPLGLLPAWIVLIGPGRPVSWVALALLLVAVPSVAGLLSWAASAVAQRWRPVHASAFAAAD